MVQGISVAGEKKFPCRVKGNLQAREKLRSRSRGARHGLEGEARGADWQYCVKCNSGVLLVSVKSQRKIVFFDESEAKFRNISMFGKAAICCARCNYWAALYKSR